MAGGHILVLQMQRLGDMVMSYPLLLWLTRVFPDSPLWVVGEPAFYQELLPVSPKAFYVPWTEIASLPVERYECIVNLSHRPEAAALAGRLPSLEVFGPVLEPGDVTRIRGIWQLYRASIVHNNRHNRFHFTELGALDPVPFARIAGTRFDPPRRLAAAENPIGLFLGASQDEKRPEPEFWAELAVQLDKRGHKPILFGGPAEADFGVRVNALSRLKMTDLCGKTTLTKLVAAMGGLSLLITPDTGPMHLAAWTGAPTLNLSMGPVNPWETGPYQPGHSVLRPLASCRGCWRCHRRTPVCREAFEPKTVALLARELVRRGADAAAKVRTPGLGLFQTGRGENGLYDLIALGPQRGANASEALSAFWSAAFLHFFGQAEARPAQDAFGRFLAGHPETAAKFRQALPLLGARLKKGLASPAAGLTDAFWTQCPPMLRPFAGFAHMLLQNGDYRLPAWKECLTLFERLIAACAS
ncbi:MAG: glycosyltransferase family 9 protein [Desulfovibrionaceae bacterium]|nr:glycosyltransferase family 9 protein [Desulfovibrionaceae bacterium]MBF0514133.1 glycosyltransferase family 9 protein [Desulfovibrionaceae bacterium]